MKYILMLAAMITFSFASIGEITAIHGKAFAIRGGHKVPLALGKKIEKKDTIKTLRNSKLQIVFNDHTVISLGQKTNFKIDDYVFSKRKVSARFSVSRGIFKSITGKIGKIDHSKFKLRTKNATIGVRGTTFIGVVGKNSEKIACTSGEIVVQNRFGAVSVKAGQITSLSASKAPKRATRYSKRFFRSVKDIQPEINSENVFKNSYTSSQSYIAKDSFVPVANLDVRENLFDLKEDISDQQIKQNIVQNTNDDISDISNRYEQAKNSEDISNQTDTFQNVKDVTDTTNSYEAGNNYDTSNSKGDVESVTEVVNSVSDTKYQTDFTQNTSNTYTNVNSNTDSDDIGGDFASIDMTKDQTNSGYSDSYAENDKYVRDLDQLKEKVNGQTHLHYEGAVSGANIVSRDSEVVLDFDLGKGSVNGNVRFKQDMPGNIQREWDTDVAGGFEQGSRFNLQAVSSGYKGNGYADLVGDHLEQAQGSMSLEKTANARDQVNINFVADKH